MLIRCATIWLLLSSLTSCEIGALDTGEGENSMLTSQFGIVVTDSKGTIRHFLTDDRQHLVFSQLYTPSSKLTPDSVYRALVYYDKQQLLPDNTEQVLLRNLVFVPVLYPTTLAEDASAEEQQRWQKTDPVGVESMWLGTNVHYLNLALLFKTGVPDEGDGKLRHAVWLEEEDETHYVFHHDQNGIPLYYTQRLYVSIPIPESLRDKSTPLFLEINTFEGVKKLQTF